ncbi:type 2 lanthipeptide synthetase LanM family protein [Mesorhizobium sp. M1156]|uniref:type 2 lanthipeptide synthetase LanM family protein n=1 Tax=Mesorhizobium sp. M1156 TaxID=2957064 RepID=UPI00333B2F7A
MYSREELYELAVRASTLDERLSEAYIPVAGLKGDTQAAAQRLALWCQSASDGDWRLFAKRLRRDGLTIEAVMPRLSAVQMVSNSPLPGWAEDLAWIGPAIQAQVETQYISSLCEAGPTQPFESLFFGVIAEAERRRDTFLPSRALSRIALSVRWSMAHELLTDVTRLCAMPIYDAFLGYLGEHPQTYDSSSTKQATEQRYDQFLLYLRETGLRRLFSHKPVLLRLLASLVRQWVDTTAEFLCRLNADFETIQYELLNGVTGSTISSIETNLSDKHNFGRSVYIVRFSCGGAAVYKPKDLRVDANWAALIAWLNSRQPPIDLRAPHVVVRDGYGWCEFINYADCADHMAAQRFFKRAGALLCISYLLVGSDLHDENLIAAGEHPVLVDIETLLQAFDTTATTGDPAMLALEAAQEKLADSVLSTGLLPCFLATPTTAKIAIGGLHDGGASKPSEISWKHINTERMEPERSFFHPRDLPNLPKINGRKQQLSDYVNVLCESCDGYFKFIRERKSEIVSKHGPIAAFAGAPVRRLLRPTRFYFLLLSRLLDHRKMWDGAAWSAHLDFVSRLADWDKDDESMWPLVAAERRALGELNIPFFFHQSDGSDVHDGRSGVVPSKLTPGLSIAYQRIDNISETNISWQLNVVRLATYNSRSTQQNTKRSNSTENRRDKWQAKPIENERAISWADKIFLGLDRCALRSGRGAAWIALNPVSHGTGWSWSPLGHDLYSGSIGLCLFLAAHARITHHTGSAALAQGGLAALRHTINSSSSARLARTVGLGGATGIGSIVYGLTVIGELLEDQGLLTDARTTTRLLTEDVIEGDTAYDVMGGAAGCVLGLLKLHRVTGDPYALGRAILCGYHLVCSRAKDARTRLWRPFSNTPLTGLAHGVAGIGYALAALAKTSGIEEFAAVARDCTAYEDGLFSAKHANWPDLRWQEQKTYWPVRWCHGAGGIGLARLGTLRFGSLGINLTDDIEFAIKAVERAWPSANNSLCCGNLGNVELLAEAGRTLGRSELTDLALSRLNGIVDAAEKSGSFGWGAGEDDDNVGFFQGSSGLGYSLLRSVAPETLPNVLIWE